MHNVVLVHICVEHGVGSVHIRGVHLSGQRPLITNHSRLGAEAQDDLARAAQRLIYRSPPVRGDGELVRAR